MVVLLFESVCAAFKLRTNERFDHFILRILHSIDLWPRQQLLELVYRARALFH